MGIQYRFARAELDSRFPRIPNFLPESRRKDQADLQRLETFALFNHPSGFFARAESQWYWQHNAEASAALEDDSFVQWNFFLGYRFPRQRATITLGILNVTDEDYRLNPLNVYTELPRERVFTARLLINF